MTPTQSMPIMKLYYIMYNIGKAKYTVSTHDGIQKHSDGSRFYGISIFKNKVKLKEYINDLINNDYKERDFTTTNWVI